MRAGEERRGEKSRVEKRREEKRREHRGERMTSFYAGASYRIRSHIQIRSTKINKFTYARIHTYENGQVGR